MIRTDLGIATAYAEAVSKGYTGTRDEFGQMFVDFGKTAEKVTEDKKSVEQMKASVEETKNSVDTTAAEFGQNVADKTEEAKEAITEHANMEKASATAAISEAKDDATDAIASAKDSATSEITKKGTDTLATIPDDYTALSKDVSSLKEDISNKITKFYASSQGETHLADSDDGKIMDMMIYGKSEQFTTTGKNLLKIGDRAQTTRGVTITAKDGVFALKGTATETGWAILDVDSFVLDGMCIMSSNVKEPKITLANKSFITVLQQSKATTLDNADASKVCFSVVNGKTYDIPNILVQIEKGSTATSYEPYTGGQPSPSPDYPQEIKSVVNPVVKVSNEDGAKSQIVALPYTLNAVPVSSGGNVTIGGQQYIADYVDVERGKLVRMVDSSKLDNTQSIVSKTEWLLAEPQEIDLTQEEVQTLKALATYYPTTNMSINSEQLDGYTVFNYPISMAEGWNYVKQQINDNRDYIYDMDAKTQDIDIQSAEAYVNSEYAVALTELEV